MSVSTCPIATINAPSNAFGNYCPSLPTMIYGGTRTRAPSSPQAARTRGKESMPKRANSTFFLRSMPWMNRSIKLISQRSFLLASRGLITSPVPHCPIPPRKFRLAETLPSHLYGGVGYGNTLRRIYCMTASPIRSRV